MFGAYSNISVTQKVDTYIDEEIEKISENKSLTVAEQEKYEQEIFETVKMPKEEAIKAYQRVVWIIMIYPIVTALIAFKIWELTKPKEEW